MIDAGFDEIHYGLWAKILTDDEYNEIINKLDQSMKTEEPGD